MYLYVVVCVHDAAGVSLCIVCHHHHIFCNHKSEKLFIPRYYFFCKYNMRSCVCINADEIMKVNEINFNRAQSHGRQSIFHILFLQFVRCSKTIFFSFHWWYNYIVSFDTAQITYTYRRTRATTRSISYMVTVDWATSGTHISINVVHHFH